MRQITALGLMVLILNTVSGRRDNNMMDEPNTMDENMMQRPVSGMGGSMGGMSGVMGGMSRMMGGQGGTNGMRNMMQGGMDSMRRMMGGQGGTNGMRNTMQGGMDSMRRMMGGQGGMNGMRNMMQGGMNAMRSMMGGRQRGGMGGMGRGSGMGGMGQMGGMGGTGDMSPRPHDMEGMNSDSSRNRHNGRMYKRYQRRHRHHQKKDRGIEGFHSRSKYHTVFAEYLDGMKNFTYPYNPTSQLMKEYSVSAAHVRGVLSAKERLLMGKLKTLNADQKDIDSLLGKMKEEARNVAEKWNKKCRDAFEKLLKELGETLKEKKDRRKAKQTFKLNAYKFIEEMEEKVVQFEKAIDKTDKGFFIDGLTEESGVPTRMINAMKDMKKITGHLSTQMDVALAERQPHYHDGHVPSMAESFLTKRLSNAVRKAQRRFSEMSQKAMQGEGNDPEEKVPVKNLQKAVHKVDAKRKSFLKEVISEMDKIVDSSRVDPKMEGLQEHLLKQSRNIMMEAKEDTKKELTEIMQWVVKQVGDEPGGHIVIRMLRQESKLELGNIQDNMGFMIKKLCDEAAETGKTAEAASGKAVEQLEKIVHKQMRETVKNLERFGKKKYEEFKNGKGIFAKIKKFESHHRRHEKRRRMDKGMDFMKMARMRH